MPAGVHRFCSPAIAPTKPISHAIADPVLSRRQSSIAFDSKHEPDALRAPAPVDEMQDAATLSRASAEAAKLFDMIDSEKTGMICRDEFRAVMRLVGDRQLIATRTRLEQHGDLSTATKHEVGVVSMFLTRCASTLEVAVSKIFPAGFGWQYASCVADGHLGLAADSAGFALCTGVGDGLGVFAGHTMYMLGKRAFVDPDIDAAHEAHTGLFLGTAAFCSGTMWQPAVDALTASGMSFTQVRDSARGAAARPRHAYTRYC